MAVAPLQEDIREFVPSATAAAQRWHARLVGSSLLKLVVVLVALVGAAAQVHGWFDARARRARLIASSEAERKAAPDAAATLDLVDATTLGLARDPFAGATSDIDRDTLDALVRKPGLYFRAVQDEVASARQLPQAAHASRKDVFVACMLQPPADESHDALRRAAVKYRWRVALDQLSPNVSDVELLDVGLRTASTAWLDEVRATHEPTALRLLEIVAERNHHEPAARPRALAAARASWIAIVVDELPTGMLDVEGPAIVQAIRTSRLDEITTQPHAVRVAIVDLGARRTVLRLRTELDAREVAVPDALADADDLQACTAAVRTRAAAR